MVLFGCRPVGLWLPSSSVWFNTESLIGFRVDGSSAGSLLLQVSQKLAVSFHRGSVMTAACGVIKRVTVNRGTQISKNA